MNYYFYKQKNKNYECIKNFKINNNKDLKDLQNIILRKKTFL